jgi:hypothetical protein
VPVQGEGEGEGEASRRTMRLVDLDRVLGPEHRRTLFGPLADESA